MAEGRRWGTIYSLKHGRARSPGQAEKLIRPNPWHLNCSIMGKMIWLAVILMALWLLGLATAYTLGGFLHILLVLSITVLVIQFTMGHREA